MEGFTFIHNKIENMLKNIEATYVGLRPEFNVQIYTICNVVH